MKITKFHYNLSIMYINIHFKFTAHVIFKPANRTKSKILQSESYTTSLAWHEAEVAILWEIEACKNICCFWPMSSAVNKQPWLPGGTRQTTWIVCWNSWHARLHLLRVFRSRQYANGAWLGEVGFVKWLRVSEQGLEVDMGNSMKGI